MSKQSFHRPGSSAYRRVRRIMRNKPGHQPWSDLYFKAWATPERIAKMLAIAYDLPEVPELTEIDSALVGEGLWPRH